MIPSYPELAGKVAVITGAAQGMGATFSQGLLAQGVHVVAVDFDVDKLDKFVGNVNHETAHQSQGSLVGVRGDVTSIDDMQGIAEQTATRFGAIDIWVNNAGLFPQSDVDMVDQDQLERTFGVNFNGVVYGAQAAAKYMAPGSSIINMSSVAATTARKGRAIYSGSKAAVEHFTNNLALEYGSKGIRVNGIAPGFIDTQMTQWLHETPGALEKALASVPLGKLGSTTDVLKSLLFLVSDSGSYISGHTIAVDGGSRHG